MHSSYVEVDECSGSLVLGFLSVCAHFTGHCRCLIHSHFSLVGARSFNASPGLLLKLHKVFMLGNYCWIYRLRETHTNVGYNFHHLVIYSQFAVILAWTPISDIFWLLLSFSRRTWAHPWWSVQPLQAVHSSSVPGEARMSCYIFPGARCRKCNPRRRIVWGYLN